MKALSKETAQFWGQCELRCARGSKNQYDWPQFSDEEIRELESDIPVGRLAEPEEIADAVSFLLSKQVIIYNRTSDLGKWWMVYISVR